MEYVANLVRHPPEDSIKNELFLVGSVVPSRTNWLQTKFSVLNFDKQSLKLILVFFVTVVYLLVLFLIKSFICWHANLLPEFPKRSSERSRMLVTIQICIPNTFSKQGTKIIQGNIMCVSNFHMDMYGNVLKFWCYDPNLCSPGQGGFYRFPSVHHFLTHSCLLFTEFSSACNWKQAFQSPVLPRSAEHIFCDPSYSFIYLFIYLFIFLSFLFSRREKRRKDYYRYLRQWIIEIFIITQPYKLCTERETKVEIALPRKITWLPSVNLCGIRSCLTVKMNREYNIL